MEQVRAAIEQDQARGYSSTDFAYAKAFRPFNLNVRLVEHGPRVSKIRNTGHTNTSIGR